MLPITQWYYVYSSENASVMMDLTLYTRVICLETMCVCQNLFT